MNSTDQPWLKSYPEDVPAEISTEQFENLLELFEHSCQRAPKKWPLLIWVTTSPTSSSIKNP